MFALNLGFPLPIQVVISAARSAEAGLSRACGGLTPDIMADGRWQSSSGAEGLASGAENVGWTGEEGDVATADWSRTNWIRCHSCRPAVNGSIFGVGLVGHHVS